MEATIEVQTRSESNGTQLFSTMRQAMEHAEGDTSVWKISVSLENGERVRLVRREESWIYEAMLTD